MRQLRRLPSFLRMMRVKKTFQDAVFDGIGQYPIVDHIRNFGVLRLAFSTKTPVRDIERSGSDASVAFVEKSLARTDVSDGFNAYVGMLGTLFASE